MFRTVKHDQLLYIRISILMSSQLRKYNLLIKKVYMSQLFEKVKLFPDFLRRLPKLTWNIEQLITKLITKLTGIM